MDIEEFLNLVPNILLLTALILSILIFGFPKLKRGIK